MQIHEAAEMYLETILVLQNRTGCVRSIDIANEMGYSKPTISVAMKQFREDGYILVDEKGVISLSDKGQKIAERVYDRHKSISAFLVAIGVSEETAAVDACKIEHDISDETFYCIKKHLK